MGDDVIYHYLRRISSISAVLPFAQKDGISFFVVAVVPAYLEQFLTIHNGLVFFRFDFDFTFGHFYSSYSSYGGKCFLIYISSQSRQTCHYSNQPLCSLTHNNSIRLPHFAQSISTNHAPYLLRPPERIQVFPLRPFVCLRTQSNTSFPLTGRSAYIVVNPLSVITVAVVSVSATAISNALQ